MRERTSRLCFVRLLAPLLPALAAGCADSAPSDSKSGALEAGAGDSGRSDAMADATPASCADAGPQGATFFPCEVEAIVAAKCQRCHTTPDVLDECVPKKSCARAPFPLLEWSDTRRDLGDGIRPVDRFVDVIASGFMPYQSKSIQPPVETLTEEEKRVLLDWARNCAPGSDRSCDSR